MASLQDVNRQATRLYELFVELGRLRSLRDPLADMHDLDLTPPQLHAVMWLGTDGPLSAGVLAKRIGSSMPACTGIVDRLERMGLCARGRSAEDRRVVLVELTKRGSKLARECHEKVLEQMGLLMSAIDPGDRAALLGIFERLVERMKTAAAAKPEESE